MARKRLSDAAVDAAKQALEAKSKKAPTPSAAEAAQSSPSNESEASDAKAKDTARDSSEEEAMPPAEAVDKNQKHQNKNDNKDQASTSQSKSEQDVSQNSTSDFDPAQLEETIANLETALATTQKNAQRREQDLLQQISTLQTQLQEQQDLNARLKTGVEQVGQLKAELEDARQMILQLSQVNAKPAPAVAPPAKVQAAEPELETSQSKAIQPVQPSRSRVEIQPKSHQVALRRILEHPTQPGALPKMPSDRTPEKKPSEMDMGWVD